MTDSPDNQLDVPQGENVNFIQNDENSSLSPYIEEVSYIGAERIIKIKAFKGIYIGLIVLLVVEVVLIILAFTLVSSVPFAKWLLILNMIPFIILFLFIPDKAICKFNYNTKRFSSYLTPIIPIPCFFYKIDISFHDISFFYFFKIPKCTKRYFKLGINTKDGEDLDIILGQDSTLSKQYDEKLFKLPGILKSYLKP